MKKMIALMLAATLLLSLAACGNTLTGTQESVTQNQEAQDMENTNTGGVAPVTLASAVYPEMAAYPDESAYVKADGSFDNEAYSAAYDAWWNAIRAQRDQQEGYSDGLDGFLTASIRQFLGDAAGENRVYSPLNVYMALAMLAELTDGESRAQVLSLLGTDSVEAVREQAKAL